MVAGYLYKKPCSYANLILLNRFTKTRPQRDELQSIKSSFKDEWFFRLIPSFHFWFVLGGIRWIGVQGGPPTNYQWNYFILKKKLFFWAKLEQVSTPFFLNWADRPNVFCSTWQPNVLRYGCYLMKVSVKDVPRKHLTIAGKSLVTVVVGVLLLLLLRCCFFGNRRYIDSNGCFFILMLVFRVCI